MKTIILTGGGTGGHIIPNLSLIPLLKQHFEKIVYIGLNNSLESELLKLYPEVTFEGISTPKLIRDKLLKNITLPFKLIKSINTCKKILKKYKPQVIFSKGGFVSLPVCIAGKLLNLPVVSHESDLTLGLANKIIYHCCTTFCTTFESTSKNLKKAVFTGSPIKSELFFPHPQKAYEISNLSPLRPTILFVGGSTGAQDLNQAVYNALPVLTKKYNVVHLTGKGKLNKNITSPHYYQTEFVLNIQDFLSISQVVVSRAGSNAICELLALKKPMLLIPLPKNASRGDQIQNANYFLKNGFASVLYQNQLTTQTLVDKIDLLLAKKSIYEKTFSTHPQVNKLLNGTQNILTQILKVSETKKNKRTHKKNKKH